MFEHYQQENAQAAFRPGILALALSLMAGVLFLITKGVVWILNFLGLSAGVPPVEVFYEPYEDGKRLEEILEGALPSPLDPLDSGSSEE